MKYLIKEIIYENYEYTNNYSNVGYQSLITKSFNVVKIISSLINDLWKEYHKQKDVYYANYNYYKKYGGIFPTNTFRETLDVISNLDMIKKDILTNIDYIKEEKYYDLGYKSYIDSLLNLVICY